MKVHCTEMTDLDELIGRECASMNGIAFAYGPLPQAMMNDEELVLENSAVLPILMAVKLKVLATSLLIAEVTGKIHAGTNFRLVLA